MTAGAPTIGGLKRLSLYLAGQLKNSVSITGGSVSAVLSSSSVSTLAAAGSNQGNAAAITAQVTSVTGANGTVGVVLPAASAGAIYVVYNSVATNGLLIYPASGGDINDGTQDAAITIEGKTMAVFVAMDSTTWGAIYTANT